jgi:malonyl-CoA O-methyltransferase
MAETPSSTATAGGGDARARPVDARALRHHLLRLHAAAQPPWLHGEVARRMAERLSLIRQRPASVLDWWPGLGASSNALAQACPKARVVGAVPQELAETAQGASGALAARWRRWRGGQRVDERQVEPRSADLLWSNMGLHWSEDPPALMRRWRALIAIDGFLMFSTLGPGTLETLRALYRDAGWGTPMAPLVDMHDLGDMLLAAGFADPVMDQEVVQLVWSDADALLAELRTLGANADPRRHAGLRTPRWRERLGEALAARAAADGRITLAFELVYGHAFCPQPPARVAAETSIALDELRSMVRSRPPRRTP